MILPALALLLASAPADATTLSVKVVSLEFSYPYFGEPGNTCKQAGSVFMKGVADPNGARTPVVVRLKDAAGLSPGTEALLGDVRRAGSGRDGTAVYCSSGRQTEPPVSPPPPPPPEAAAPAAQPATPAAQAAPATPPAPATKPAPAPASSAARCTARLFHIVKKPLADDKFGPSEFDPDSGFETPEPVDCSLARSRVTNVLLLKMVKDKAPKPNEIVGAEWGPGSTWQKAPDAQRRVVKVYFVEPPAES